MLAQKSSRKQADFGTKSSPPVDVYTGLMFVGFTALVIGCVLMVLELGQYGWQAAG